MGILPAPRYSSFVSEIHELSAADLVVLRQSAELSAVEMVEHFLSRIEDHNESLNALVTVTAETALERALAMDEGLLDPGILWGLPFADKDLTNRAGVITGAGSRTNLRARPSLVSDPIAIALDEAGGISLGKTAVCEFGLTSYTESLVFPPTRNPYALGIGSGGSSGGAAAAVAGRLLPLAPGSDGGGSIRIPSWICGLVGLKPSRGSIPTGTGSKSLADLVVPGTIARTISDSALLIDAMVGGHAINNPSKTDLPNGAFFKNLDADIPPLRIGFTERHPWENSVETELDPIARKALNIVRVSLEGMGHSVEELNWEPHFEYADAFKKIWQASAAMLQVAEKSHALLEPFTRYLYDSGTKLDANKVGRALQALSKFEEETKLNFSQHDLVLTPGLSTPPPPVGFYATDDPEKNFEQQVRVTPYSSFVNVAGLPALALPVLRDSSGLPYGIQLVGRSAGELTLLRVGKALETSLNTLEVFDCPTSFSLPADQDC